LCGLQFGTGSGHGRYRLTHQCIDNPQVQLGIPYIEFVAAVARSAPGLTSKAPKSCNVYLGVSVSLDISPKAAQHSVSIRLRLIGGALVRKRNASTKVDVASGGHP
jgi:hypothetical protein